MKTNTLHAQARKLTALIDPDAPAKVTRWANEPAIVAAKQYRHGVTREPDVLDEVAGEAIWLDDDLAVVVPLERLDAFRAYVNCRGLAPCGRGAFNVQSMHHEGSVECSWERLDRAVRAS